MNTDADITLTRGDDERVVIPVEDGDSGGYRDLTGVDVTYQITTARGSGTVEHELTSADSAVSIVEAGTIDSTALSELSDTTDVIDIDLAASVTSELTEHRYAHECELTDADGRTTTVMQGDVYVSDSST